MKKRLGLNQILMLAFVASLGLLICSHAVAQTEAPAPTTPEVQSEQTPAPPTSESPARRASFYIHPLWLLLLTFSVGFWLYLTAWASKDARGLEVNQDLVCLIFMGVGALGPLLTFLIHGAFSFLTIALVLGAFIGYTMYRNKKVPQQHKLFGAYHRAEIISSIPIVNLLAGANNTGVVARLDTRITNASGKSLEDVMAEQPQLSQGAQTFGESVHRACSMQCSKVRVFRHQGQYVTQIILDGVPQILEALPDEHGQKVVAAASLFVGLAQGGKIRKGSKSFHVELPGHPPLQISAHITSANGKPALVMDMPDWTADLYQKGVEALGVHESLRRRLRTTLDQPKGAVIISGRQGSGTTTTLYGVVQMLDMFTTDVMALEQTEKSKLENVRRRIIPADQPFERFFEDILREEPQALMFGDLRNASEARLLLRYAIEQGKVLADMKAQSASAALLQLKKLVGDTELLGSSITCITNQKLARRLCKDCREPVEPNPELFRKLRISPEEAGNWHRPVGCEKCLGTGYKGRIGLFSMLLMTDQVRDALARGAVSESEIRSAAGKEAYRAMFYDGLTKVASGITSFEEIQRVVRGVQPVRKEPEGKRK
ncbi:MAG: Flp pilus assembly complex ATPase component TadA [Planctomycetes bacterium]|nr:Flp pilus assembly complex ATPase component TadA [Planctomycetota bacterium]